MQPFYVIDNEIIKFASGVINDRGKELNNCIFPFKGPCADFQLSL